MKQNKKNRELLTDIPGIGKSTSQNLRDIGIQSVSDLKDKNPEMLFELSNQHAGVVQDRCLLYVFRAAVYFANGGRNPDKLKWWNWKDKEKKNSLQKSKTNKNN